MNKWHETCLNNHKGRAVPENRQLIPESELENTL